MTELCYTNNPSSLFRKYARLITSLTKHQAFRDYVSEGAFKMPQEPLVLLLPNGYIKQLDKKAFELTVTTKATYSPKLYPALRTIDFFNKNKWYSSFEEMQRALLHELTDLKLYRNPLGYRYEDARLHFLQSTFNPDASPETTSVDGKAQRSGQIQTWEDLRNGAGTSASDADPTDTNIGAGATTTTDRFSGIFRNFTLFDTSSLPDDANISAATFSNYIQAKEANLAVNVGLYLATTASNTAIVAGDYEGTNGNTTKQSDTATAVGSISTGAYYDQPLNATGLGNISKTGITKLGGRLTQDADNSAPAWVSGVSGQVQGTWAEDTSGTKDPKLVVDYTLPSSETGYSHFM